MITIAMRATNMYQLGGSLEAIRRYFRADIVRTRTTQGITSFRFSDSSVAGFGKLEN